MFDDQYSFSLENNSSKLFRSFHPAVSLWKRSFFHHVTVFFTRHIDSTMSNTTEVEVDRDYLDQLAELLPWQRPFTSFERLIIVTFVSIFVSVVGCTLLCLICPQSPIRRRKRGKDREISMRNIYPSLLFNHFIWEVWFFTLRTCFHDCFSKVKKLNALSTQILEKVFWLSRHHPVTIRSSKLIWINYLQRIFTLQIHRENFLMELFQTVTEFHRIL